ncbi:MAG: S41 family peptidase, partial [Acidiferrobacterales bacterium]|nr:S41 family peptidase [Acidiferrobacterales bacterium]
AATFDVFWQTYFEHYPFFAMKGVDWEAVRHEYRPQITTETTNEELFEIFQKMIEPLQDAHTFLYAPSLDNGWFEGRRPNLNPLTNEDRARSAEIIETEYLRSPLQPWLNEQVAFAVLDGAVGYLRISSFIGYTDDGDFQTDHEALEAVLDEIFKKGENLKGLVIDVRLNDGGWDGHGLAIAGRLTESEYLAYTKQARNDPTDPDQWTVAQPSLVRPSSRPGYLGPAVLLTGPDSISAAETFAMALMGREPEVIRIGENTQGVFSDVPFRALPNGWLFGVPNERYLTEEGQSFDGVGIPPDIAVPVFPRSDLESGRDGALEKALELLMEAYP